MIRTFRILLISCSFIMTGMNIHYEITFNFHSGLSGNQEKKEDLLNG